ncbi:MAG: rhomboid family intramembrane serine protease [Candidatus Omnitrophica bacterium]|nr:rhomboid family intramembrane serine protease [Candidatus Omnitrophota bacterium]
MPQYRNPSSGFGQFLTPSVKKLLIINTAVFLASYLFRSLPWSELAMTPHEVFHEFKIWQLFTYMFLHHDIMHLVWNMLILYFCGPSLERVWGSREFLVYYFFSGIGAALCSFIFSFNASIIGASGAIYGLLVACAFIFPEALVLVFFLFPMKIRHFVILIMAMSILGAFSSSSNGIAHFAHLGGGLFGFLYLKSEWLKHKLLGVDFSLNFKRKGPPGRKSRKTRFENLDNEVDRILDKISKKGISSLSRRERQILEEKSKKSL